MRPVALGLYAAGCWQPVLACITGNPDSSAEKIANIAKISYEELQQADLDFLKPLLMNIDERVKRSELGCGDPTLGCRELWMTAFIQ